MIIYIYIYNYILYTAVEGAAPWMVPSNTPSCVYDYIHIYMIILYIQQWKELHCGWYMYMYT